MALVIGFLAGLGLVAGGCGKAARDVATPKETPKGAKVPEQLPVLPGVSRAKVRGRVVGPDEKPLAGVRVLFGPVGSQAVLASVTNEEGLYEGEAPVGQVELRVTHRVVDASGKAKATILYFEKCEVPKTGAAFDIRTARGIPR